MWLSSIINLLKNYFRLPIISSTRFQLRMNSPIWHRQPQKPDRKASLRSRNDFDRIRERERRWYLLARGVTFCYAPSKAPDPAVPKIAQSQCFVAPTEWNQECNKACVVMTISSQSRAIGGKAPNSHIGQPDCFSMKSYSKQGAVNVLKSKATGNIEPVKHSLRGGFTLIELLTVVLITITVVGVAVPSYLRIAASLRASGDLRSLTGVAAQAKMRAPSDFTRARVYANLNGNSFQLEIWNKAGACWVADADSTNTCLTYTSGAPSGNVTSLSRGDTFGFGTLTAGPTPGQVAISQAAQCLNNTGTAIASTACIVFNSRGIPINGSTLAPLATGALYLTNGVVVDGLTISATGSIQTWSANPNAPITQWTGQ